MRETNFIIIFGIIWGLIEFSCAQRNRCGIDKFTCNDGQCIASDLLCDGQPDCRDQSDETYIECNKPELTCPDYTFRCSYGACVDGDKTCNGVKDCIDNSDETLSRCNYGSFRNTTSRLCLSNQFKCNSGQCIPNSNICDGTADCADKSDETSDQCGSLTCELLFFQCSYGACIEGNLLCNGIEDCADGSDENPTRCNNVETTAPTRPPYITAPTRPPYITAPTRPPYITAPTRPPYTTTEYSPYEPEPEPVPPKKCIVPPHPQYGTRRVVKAECSERENCEIKSGDEVDKGTQLVYSCNTGYKLNGSRDVFCDTEYTWVNIPVCEEIRCPALDSISRTAKCQHDTEEVHCNSSVSIYTRAILHCKNAYIEDAGPFRKRDTKVTCNINGIWEPDPIECIPDCGKTVGQTQKLIVGGKRADISELPWHATLYKKNPITGIKEFICGASIIKENLVITAAHCVTEENNTPEYYVATGNIFRDYDYAFHDTNFVTKAVVKDIHVHSAYYGIKNNYESDIAILRVEPVFTFSSVLRPICLDTIKNGDYLALDSTSIGKTAGFGRTATGQSSAILQTLDIPFVSFPECKKIAAKRNNEHFVTINKICAGYLNGSSVCDGDSGGGLAFKTEDLWYLRGIVSTSLAGKNVGGATVCDNELYTLFTKVSAYMDWIQQILRNYSNY